VEETAERPMDVAEAHSAVLDMAASAFVILPPRSASRARASITIFRPRPRWLLLSHGVMRTDFSLRLRGDRMRLPTTLSPRTERP
jgi:hypothetical protein